MSTPQLYADPAPPPTPAELRRVAARVRRRVTAVLARRDVEGDGTDPFAEESQDRVGLEQLCCYDFRPPRRPAAAAPPP